ncbi:hypothetical protein PHLCEN_2v6161 [Hermanssonia centrifuga]|uniref:Uncharacterized protein n=1 Tax=Hermanssonia centrifuga TaxID=98765 RepID=A0A2R6P0A9_9APHY|nr:hypothetical protein PHLCEN_2v6161 [Hermanssonia centrifuga]
MVDLSRWFSSKKRGVGRLKRWESLVEECNNRKDSLDRSGILGRISPLFALRNFQHSPL